jgi:hypothetical protein
MRWLFLLLLCLPGLAQAQVNVEKLRSAGIEDGFSGSLGLTSAFTTGNILFADFGTSSHVEWKQDKDLLFWVLNARFAAKRTQSDLIAEPSVGLWDKEAHFSNLMLQHVRYNRTLAKTWWWEVFSQYEFNEFLLLDRRLIAGTGPRVALTQTKKGGIWLGTSAMLEEERLIAESIAPREDVQSIHVRSSSYLTFTVQPTENTLWVTTAYYQPRFDALSDFRFASETSMSFKMNKRLSFTLDARMRHDSKPPETPTGSAPVLSTDISIKNGIKLNW